MSDLHEMAISHRAMNYPKAPEDKIAEAQFDLIELTAYMFNRAKFTPEQMKLMGYPNVDILEERYEEMMG